MPKDIIREMDARVIRSSRRTIAIEIKSGRVIVRAPDGCPKSVLEDMLAKNREKIERILKTQREKMEAMPPEPSQEEIRLLAKEAMAALPLLVDTWSRRMGVKPAGITITSARTRWGSCSAKNRLSFSCRLMRMPQQFIEYVVVHELAHIREKNHSKAFYAIVEKYLPDWKERKKAGRV